MWWWFSCCAPRQTRFNVRAQPVLRDLRERERHFSREAAAYESVAKSRRGEAVEYYNKNLLVQAQSAGLEAKRNVAMAARYMRIIEIIDTAIEKIQTLCVQHDLVDDFSATAHKLDDLGIVQENEVGAGDTDGDDDETDTIVGVDTPSGDSQPDTDYTSGGDSEDDTHGGSDHEDQPTAQAVTPKASPKASPKAVTPKVSPPKVPAKAKRGDILRSRIVTANRLHANFDTLVADMDKQIQAIQIAPVDPAGAQGRDGNLEHRSNKLLDEIHSWVIDPSAPTDGGFDAASADVNSTGAARTAMTPGELVAEYSE
jgi:hypothetical protein